jgi:hypothetical protein
MPVEQSRLLVFYANGPEADRSPPTGSVMGLRVRGDFTPVNMCTSDTLFGISVREQDTIEI